MFIRKMALASAGAVALFSASLGLARAADMVERLGILDAMFPAQGTAALEDKLFDVVAVGGGIVVAEEGEALSRGAYRWRWEIETSYRELKVEQKLEGGLRCRTREGIEYEVAGHVLHYLLVRWLLVEAAASAGISPLRLSFKEALRDIIC